MIYGVVAGYILWSVNCCASSSSAFVWEAGEAGCYRGVIAAKRANQRVQRNIFDLQ